MNYCYIIIIILALVVFTTPKEKGYSSINRPYPADEVPRSWPKRLTTPDIKVTIPDIKVRCPVKQVNYNNLEKRQSMLIKHKYSYEDRVGNSHGTRCYTNIGSNLESLPAGYKNQWKVDINSRLKEEYPLLDADVNTIKKLEYITREPGGHLYNLAKKSKNIIPYAEGNFFPGRYATRNGSSNYYHLGYV